MNLAIDYDETIQDNREKRPGYRMGPPMPGAVSIINRLHTEGHHITIFTARNVQEPKVKQAVADWLDYFKIPFHDITNIKRSEFDVYIDNRALHFQSWTQVALDLKKAEESWGVWSNHVPAHGGLIDDITKPLT